MGNSLKIRVKTHHPLSFSCRFRILCFVNDSTTSPAAADMIYLTVIYIYIYWYYMYIYIYWYYIKYYFCYYNCVWRAKNKLSSYIKYKSLTFFKLLRAWHYVYNKICICEKVFHFNFPEVKLSYGEKVSSCRVNIIFQKNQPITSLQSDDRTLSSKLSDPLR